MFSRRLQIALTKVVDLRLWQVPMQPRSQGPLSSFLEEERRGHVTQSDGVVVLTKVVDSYSPSCVCATVALSHNNLVLVFVGNVSNVACSRLRDSGEGANMRKTSANISVGAGEGSRACLTYAFPFVPILLSESLKQAMGNVVRTLEVAESGRLFQKLNICCVRDICRSSSSSVTEAISLSHCPLTRTQFPRGNIAANIYWLVRGFAMRHWSFLLHRRKIGSGRME